MKNMNGDAIIDIEIPQKVNGFSLYDYFYVKDLERRRLSLNTDIDICETEEIVNQILRYNVEDIGLPVEKRKPILLIITSNGGSVSDGFQLIDVIQSSKTPVYTINIGYQYSMGFLIGLAGHKRYASKNATFLIHDGSNMVWNSGSKVQDQMEFYKRLELRIKKYVLERTNISEIDYDNNLRKEWYLFADEAKERGITDFIIGEDCDIDAIL